MRDLGPNLAAQPFANERPVKRTTLLIWVLALILLAINVYLYQRHLSAQYEQRQAIRNLQESVEIEEQAIAQGEADLASLDLGQQNDEVIFLNGQIARRTFSWSRLFDRLEEVLPDDVELSRVSPKTLEERRGRHREGRLKDLVTIDLRGRAETADEMLELVDNLFAHPSFTLPNLMGENLRDDGSVEFTLKVLYLPTAKPEETPAEDAEMPQSSAEEAVLLTATTESIGDDG